MQAEGRINVHTYDAKEWLIEHYGRNGKLPYGFISALVRGLLEAVKEGRVRIDPKVGQLYKAGNDEEAAALLAADLQHLRAIRINAGQQATEAKRAAGKAKGKKAAGVIDPAKQRALDMVDKMLAGGANDSKENRDDSKDSERVEKVTTPGAVKVA